MRDITQQFIDNRWVPSQADRRLSVVDPYREQVLGTVTAGHPDDVDTAVAAARRALPAWRDMGGVGRAGFIEAFADGLESRKPTLVELSSTNNGKIRAEAALDLEDAIACYRYYAQQARELDTRQNRPVEVAMPGVLAERREEAAGVVGLITPWNFPLVTSAWKTAPALAAGCTVVLKPSEVTPLPESVLVDVALECGLPAGVFNMVFGDGEGVGAPLSRHRGIDRISFTGSNPVGESVMREAAAGTRNVALELGGKSPIVVLDDADPEQAADWIMAGLYFNAGQICSATSRLIVDETIAEPVYTALADRIDGLVLGDPLAEVTSMGPLTSASQRARVRGYLATAEVEGLKVVRDARHRVLPDTGYFVAPTLYRDVPTSSRLWCEEIFGPVLCGHSVCGEAGAIALANDSDFGLAATVVAGDQQRARRVASFIDAGTVWFNSEQLVLPQAGWGGMKRSGIGRELGPGGLAEYLEVKHVIGPASTG
ncbi:MAG: aldehyde dehydrogenase family protein [Salinisphaera sp.]|uniref:aldehyde dehydrogenase family protein n=1 Tax=Salinisphaera sp. TaxID=1914330 RepID=UPI003C7D6CE5